MARSHRTILAVRPIAIDALERRSMFDAVPHLAFAAQPIVATYTNAALPTVTVDVLDSTGALLTTDGSAVTLALSDAAGTLVGTTTVAAVGGVATFSDLSIPTEGTYRLVASTATYTAATSTAFSTFAPITAGTPVDRSIGGPDPLFGVGGVAVHAVGFSSTVGVAADGSGSVLIGSVGVAPNRQFGVARYLADGSLDTTFGTAGVAKTPIPGTDAAPAAVAVMANGSILVAGTATTFASDGTTITGRRFAVASYTATGALDATFGTDGIALVSIGDGTAATVLRTLVVGANGRIYLAGKASGDLAVAALTSTGALDATFGTNGTVLLDVAGGADAVVGIALQSNGDVVLGGWAVVGDVTDVVVARLLPTGVTDRRFGHKGITITQDPPGSVYEAAYSVSINPTTGRIVVGGLASTGTAANPSANVMLRRFNPNGQLDRSFGTNGTVLTSFGQASSITSVVVAPDGTVTATGRTTAALGGVQDLIAARYTANGKLDATFGRTGATSINLGGGGESTVTNPSTLKPAGVAIDLGAAFNAFTLSTQGALAITSTGEILTTGQAGADAAEVQLVAAGLDLATAVVANKPTTIVAGRRSTVTVTITEIGTARANGSVTIALSFSTDVSGTNAGAASPVLGRRINVRAGQGKPFRLTVVAPSTVGAWYAVASVTVGEGLSDDLNPINNTAVATSPITVAAAAAAH